MHFFPQWVNQVRASQATPAMRDREREREEAMRKATEGFVMVSPPLGLGGKSRDARAMASEEGPR